MFVQRRKILHNQLIQKTLSWISDNKSRNFIVIFHFNILFYKFWTKLYNNHKLNTYSHFKILVVRNNTKEFALRQKHGHLHRAKKTNGVLQYRYLTGIFQLNTTFTVKAISLLYQKIFYTRGTFKSIGILRLAKIPTLYRD